MKNHQSESLKQKSKIPMMEAFEAHLQALGHRMESVRTMGNDVRRFAAWLGENGRTAETAAHSDIVDWLAHLRECGLAARTRSSYLNSVKKLYRWLEKQGRITENPCTELEILGTVRGQLPPPVAFWKLENTYQNWPAHGLKGKRDKVTWGLLVFQGLRTGTLAKLETTDIDLENAQIHVPSMGMDNGRTLPLLPVQLLPLQEYLLTVRPALIREHPRQTEALLISSGTSHRLGNAVSGLIKTARKLCPEVKNAAHVRSSVISHWLKTHNLREVQHKAGHRYLSSTERYATDKLESLREKIERLHPLQ